MFDLAIINGKVYTDHGWRLVNVYIQDGKFAVIGNETLPAKEIYDAKGYEVLPGLIDPHVHFALDLGWIVSRDDFVSGSIAASHGGITSIIDFLPPTHNAAELEQAFHARKKEASRSYVDYHLHATICQPDGDLEAYVLKMKELGMHTLKLFTTYADSNRNTADNDIIELLKLAEKYHFLLMAHIEDDSLIIHDDSFGPQDLPISRPSKSETDEATKLAGYVRLYGGHLYMVHLSSGATLQVLLKEYPDIVNKKMFIESCPHYFVFDQDMLKGDQGYLYTCAPPIRTKEEQALLEKHMNRIDTIGTDHCAFNAIDKNKKFLREIPLGLGGIEHSFSIMRHIMGTAAIAKMGPRVAELMGLKNKGQIKAGYDADVAIFQPIADCRIEGHHGATDHSLYAGLAGSGRFTATLSRGRFVMKEGTTLAHEGHWIEGMDIE